MNMQWNQQGNPTVEYFRQQKTFTRTNARKVLTDMGAEKTRLPRDGACVLLQIPQLMIVLNIDAHGDYFQFSLKGDL